MVLGLGWHAIKTFLLSSKVPHNLNGFLYRARFLLRIYGCSHLLSHGQSACIRPRGLAGHFFLRVAGWLEVSVSCIISPRSSSSISMGRYRFNGPMIWTTEISIDVRSLRKEEEFPVLDFVFGQVYSNIPWSISSIQESLSIVDRQFVNNWFCRSVFQIGSDIR